MEQSGAGGCSELQHHSRAGWNPGHTNGLWRLAFRMATGIRTSHLQPGQHTTTEQPFQLLSSAVSSRFTSALHPIILKAKLHTDPKKTASFWRRCQVQEVGQSDAGGADSDASHESEARSSTAVFWGAANRTHSSQHVC